LGKAWCLGGVVVIATFGRLAVYTSAIEKAPAFVSSLDNVAHGASGSDPVWFAMQS